jgi:hypothetical protein
MRRIDVITNHIGSGGEKLATFSVFGPIEMPTIQERFGRLVSRDFDKWYNLAGYILYQPGCYVFGIRAGQGYTPNYAGMTSNKLYDKALSFQNLALFYNPIYVSRKGTPIMFLISQINKKGDWNISQIPEVENYLISVIRKKIQIL